MSKTKFITWFRKVILTISNISSGEDSDIKSDIIISICSQINGCWSRQQLSKTTPSDHVSYLQLASWGNKIREKNEAGRNRWSTIWNRADFTVKLDCSGLYPKETWMFTGMATV